ncbi:aminotransferase class IV [Microbacterium indicum]|uniref:aminotransferase class IV n=1 Tax=Microbacterium indicum TaxID=358100 RepID=UPI0004042A5D|nr:aminotransferase class IV [Microbacterium indicum]
MQQLDGASAAPGDLQALAMIGFAHFTTMRAESGAVRGLGLHLDRLARDARLLFDAELDPDLVRRRIRDALADEPAVATVRVTLFDPDLRLERTGADAHPRILVTPRPAAPGAGAPLRVRSVRFGRDVPELKHTGMFGALYRRRQAQRDGFDDAVFVDAAGRLSEGPTWNIGFVQGDRVVWPDGGALGGVTRDLLAEVAGESATEPVTLERAGVMDAAFATSSGAGVRPIVGIDGAAFPAAHPVFERLSAAYEAIPGEPI